MVKESTVVGKITKRMENLGALVFNIHGDVYMHRGLPDLIVIMSGKVLFLEVKRPGGRVRPMQLHIQKKIRRRGVISEIVSSVEEAERALELAINI